MPDNQCPVCSELCDKRCGHCRKVWYCSKEHQKVDRRSHKPDCFPAKEIFSKEKGAYFVATRNIKPLEVIWTEKPILIAPNNGGLLPLCLGCCKLLPGTIYKGFPTCSHCKWPLCSPNCKDIQWHSEFECPVFVENNIKPTDLERNNKDILVYKTIKILRMILLKKNDADKWSKITSLKSHVDLLARKSFEATLYYLANFIQNKCNMMEELHLIAYLYGIVCRNSSCLCDQIQQTHKSLTFEKSSKMLHRCQSNTMRFTKCGRVATTVYATVEIKSDESLYTIYDYDTSGEAIDILGQIERRTQLYDRYNFWCKCVMCTDSTEQGTFYSAIKCNEKIEGKTCSGYLLPCIVKNPLLRLQVEDGKWRCNFPNCKAEENSSDAVYEITQKIQGEIEESEEVGDCEEKLNIIAKHENVTVHENHYLLTKLRFSLLPHLLREFEDIANDSNRNEANCLAAGERLISFAEKCLKITDKFLPGTSLLRGVILFHVVGENTVRLTYNVSNTPERNLEVAKMREEALSILKLSANGTFGKHLYHQLQTNFRRHLPAPPCSVEHFFVKIFGLL